VVMKPWILQALLSMFFAGFTSVIARRGLTGISGEMGLTLRTAFVFVLVLGFAALTIPLRTFCELKRENFLWLGLSGVTTALSWIFYYKALKDGEVSTIALIDKGSVLVAVVLAAIFLKEIITLRMCAGGLLMVAGILIIATK
jgi:transporter family protein